MEFALIGLIVAGALLFMVRRARRALAPEQDACTAGCGCCSSCPAARQCARAGQGSVVPAMKEQKPEPDQACPPPEPGPNQAMPKGTRTSPFFYPFN